MTPPVFATCRASSEVQDLLGTNPCRLYRFGDAPETVIKPYAVWQSVSGTPENYLGQVPDIDSFTVQIDVYALTASSAAAVAKALQDAIEPVAHVTAYNGETRDPDTKNYRYSFTVDWWVERE